MPDIDKLIAQAKKQAEIEQEPAKEIPTCEPTKPTQPTPKISRPRSDWCAPTRSERGGNLTTRQYNRRVLTGII